MPKKHILAFDLSYDEVLKHHLPKALIVENENPGLGYVAKMANTQTLNSFEIELDKVSSELVLLSDRLHPHALHKRYNANNRVAKPIKELLKNTSFKSVINQYIERLLENFFKLISKTEILLSFHLEKNQRFENRQVFLSTIKLEPKLYFHKKEEVLDYRLSLSDGKNELIPSQEKFTILLNEPSYVLHNKNIHQLKYINANKLKPFLSKEVIKIPKRTSVEYFKKFIKKVVKKAPIEAKGFDVITYNTCESCIIKPTTTIFSKVYHLELSFVYKNHSFSILDKTQKHIKFDYNDEGEFTVF